MLRMQTFDYFLKHVRFNLLCYNLNNKLTDTLSIHYELNKFD